jgi:lipoprotein NlpD
MDRRTPFISPAQGDIITGFREEYYNIENSTHCRHTGVDISGDPGEKVVASANGIVYYTGLSPRGGLTVVIKHNKKIRTTYLNLSSIYVNKGDIVRQGDIIACLGARDDPSSKLYHLHFAVIYGNAYLDPVQLLNIEYSSISRYLRLFYMEKDCRIY